MYQLEGANVGHLGPGVAKLSIMGLVFSYDEDAMRYSALTEIKQPRDCSYCT